MDPIGTDPSRGPPEPFTMSSPRRNSYAVRYRCTIAPSGLKTFWDTPPGALPRAFLFRPFGAPERPFFPSIHQPGAGRLGCHLEAVHPWSPWSGYQWLAERELRFGRQECLHFRMRIRYAIAQRAINEKLSP